MKNGCNDSGIPFLVTVRYNLHTECSIFICPIGDCNHTNSGRMTQWDVWGDVVAFGHLESGFVTQMKRVCMSVFFHFSIGRAFCVLRVVARTKQHMLVISLV